MRNKVRILVEVIVPLAYCALATVYPVLIFTGSLNPHIYHLVSPFLFFLFTIIPILFRPRGIKYNKWIYLALGLQAGIVIFTAILAIQDNFVLTAFLGGIALGGLIVSKVGVLVWASALLPALKAIPAALSGYYVKKLLDDRGKKKKDPKPPASIAPSKGREQKAPQAPESESERELL